MHPQKQIGSIKSPVVARLIQNLLTLENNRNQIKPGRILHSHFMSQCSQIIHILGPNFLFPLMLDMDTDDCFIRSERPKDPSCH